jgi:glyoxylase-like metal-dependent hydrolase (beta-lactamase superfamily II)
MTQEELEFATSEAAQRRLVFDEHLAALKARHEPLILTGTPYEIFPESADLFSDGSVVAVRLPGHTPGHLGVIVNVTPTLRLFYVADAVSAEAGFQQRVPKSFVLAYSDEDPETAGKTVSLLAGLHDHARELVMLPGHDRAAWVRVFGPEGGCLGAAPPASSPPPEPVPTPDGGVE